MSITVFVLAVLTVASYLRLSSLAYDPLYPHFQHGERYNNRGSRGAVASESTICSNVGIEIIRDGGNAADAVIIMGLRRILC